MSFNYGQYIPIAIAVCFFVILFIWKKEKHFYTWIKNHWFYDRSLTSKVSSLFYILGVSVLILSCLDLRGPETKIEANVVSQKTMILIDNSKSMLVEDIRPNRLAKAVQVAKHFSRKAVGHHIGVALFSDIMVKIVPFTDDRDLLDARLNAVKNLEKTGGGSNIKKSLQEAINFFRSNTNQGVYNSGNILVLTDAEETYGQWNLDVPDNISIAFLGIGTRAGGKIPRRTDNGALLGYVKNGPEEVVSKLDEAEIRNLSTKIKNFKYWILGSYVLPTEEVIGFFDNFHIDRNRMSDIVIKPSLSEYLVIPGLIFLTLGLVLRFFKSFHIASILLLCMSYNSFSQESSDENAKPVDPLLIELQSKLKEGSANKEERLKLGELYLKNQKDDIAVKIYEENLETKSGADLSKQKSIFNYATGLIKTGKQKQGLEILRELYENTDDELIKKDIRNNILASIIQQKQQKKDDQDNQDNDQDKDEKKDQNKKQDSSQSNSDKKNSKNDSKNDQQDNQDNKDKKNEQQKDDQNNNDEKDKDKDKKDEPEDQNDDDKNNNKKDQNDQNDDEKQEEKKNAKSDPSSSDELPKDLRKKTKLPVLLQQLVDKDKKLQEKFFKTGTQKSSGDSQGNW